MGTIESFRGAPAEWDALCASFDDFTPTQSHGWGEARALEGWRVHRDVWRASGVAVAAATRLTRRRLGAPITYVSRGPLVGSAGIAPEDAERRFVACIEDYRRGLPLGGLLLCSIYPSLAEIGPAAIHAAGLSPLFPTSSPRWISSMLSLDAPDVLPRAASSDWRNRYKKSEALLTAVRSTGDPERFVAARRLVAEIERTKGFASSVTDALVRALAASGSRLFFLENERGETTAAMLLAVAGRRAFRLIAAVAPGETRTQPGIGRVLEAAATRWAFEAGCRAYDLEGLDPRERGVWDFKTGMRGRLFASGGLHAASRPRVLAALLSYQRRRGWETPLLLWRSSRRYFFQTALRRATRGRLDVRRMLLYTRELDTAPPLSARPGFTMLAVDRFDREAFRYRLSTARELWDRTKDAAPRRRECIVLLGPDGYAAGYGFLGFEAAPIPEIGTTLPLPADEAFISDCVILPEFRGQKLYAYLLDHLCAQAKRHKAARVRIAVDAGNVPSVRGIEAAGFVRDREAAYRRTGRSTELRWNPSTT